MGEARINLERMLLVTNGMFEGVILGESDTNEKMNLTSQKREKGLRIFFSKS
jgi:hypothetical protein